MEKGKFINNHLAKKNYCPIGDTFKPLFTSSSLETRPNDKIIRC